MNRRGLLAALIGAPIAGYTATRAEAAWPEIAIEPVWPPPPLAPGWEAMKPIQPFLGEVRTVFHHYVEHRPLPRNGDGMPVAVVGYEQWNGTNWKLIEDPRYAPLEVACGNTIAD